MHLIKREFTWKGMRQKQRGRLRRLSAAGLLVAVGLALGMFVSGVVYASHTFSDVPTGAFYHNAVEWVFNRGITAGCAAGMYCPNDAVTRGTMAVFLRALGVALTPTYLDVATNSGALDPDSNPVICQTPDFTVTGYPRTALVDGQVSFSPEGPTTIGMRNAVSIDGGASWINVNAVAQGVTSTAGAQVLSANSHGRSTLAFLETYRFGIQISRGGGLPYDIQSSACEMHVAIVNRNGTSSPLSPSR